jgi:hypothetical protein
MSESRSNMNLLNPIAAWQFLPQALRDRIGPAAIAHVLGLIGAIEEVQPAQGYQAADHEGYSIIAGILADHLPSAWLADGMTPRRPDLAALGIRTCRHCGCTDASPRMKWRARPGWKRRSVRSDHR